MKIISGGQTGVDRAALDAAIKAGIDYGGWCPKCGWAEDLPHSPGLFALYPHLRATPSGDPLQRTEWNVRDAGWLMLLVDASGIDVSQGTRAARDFAVALGKPIAAIDLDAGDAFANALAFLGDGKCETLCIAGPRKRGAGHLRQGEAIFVCRSWPAWGVTGRSTCAKATRAAARPLRGGRL